MCVLRYCYVSITTSLRDCYDAATGVYTTPLRGTYDIFTIKDIYMSVIGKIVQRSIVLHNINVFPLLRPLCPHPSISYTLPT